MQFCNAGTNLNLVNNIMTVDVLCSFSYEAGHTIPMQQYYDQLRNSITMLEGKAITYTLGVQLYEYPTPSDTHAKLS